MFVSHGLPQFLVPSSHLVENQRVPRADSLLNRHVVCSGPLSESQFADQINSGSFESGHDETLERNRLRPLVSPLSVNHRREEWLEDVIRSVGFQRNLLNDTEVIVARDGCQSEKDSADSKQRSLVAEMTVVSSEVLSMSVDAQAGLM